MQQWRVHVDVVGFIGTVREATQDLARCAALHEFAEEGNRPNGSLENHIFEDDKFDVHEEQA